MSELATDPVQPRRVLVVDDSEVEGLYIQALLQPEFTVIVANNLIAFWAHMAEEAPDLILLDVMMKEITGFELAQQLKRNHEYKAIPIIFVTSLDQAGDIERGFEVGGHDYVKKPFLTQELRARVRSALRLKNLEHDLRMRSVTDYLTGAYNRRYFFEAVNSNLSYAQRMRRNLCIAVLDIDFFKKINDEYGHEAGDAVLVHFTNTIRDQIRKYDILARFGGEEFVIQFFDCTIAKCVDMLNRVKNKLIETPCITGGRTINYTFSAGLASLEEIAPKEPIERLIEQADRRLYHAKETGRNRFVTEAKPEPA
ncbi:diguanylate cyclase [Turneriella parva]|uniref:diguanylate cyclase n=1 Tax=Turneriella parva (strain ATCC BAA-1111 / DSM 21527 / NCTC 11395 / H) TaxID=869212 RepID=I4B4Z0_TURPD|nr:diguanylate cyclase [Turneriella parva]AFM12347.1 response regulator receiver modulated diguanylate cyclase [Turneriella parva DSM 21527]